MQQYRKFFGRAFVIISAVAALFVITEMVLQSIGKSICQTEGCKMVTQFTRFGDISILLMGLVTFSVLTLLSILVIYKDKTRLERYINIILIVSLSAEGFFAGYQAFRLSAACIFCLIIMAFFMVLALVRLLYGEKELVSGFVSFAAIFSLFYLVLPVGSTVRLPDDELVLFYSRECKYCAEVIREMEANNLKVKHVLVGEYSAFLQEMGIEHVPTLYVNKKNQKIYLTGKEAIDQYLGCIRPSGARENVSRAKNKKVAAGEPGRSRDQKKTEAPRETGRDDLDRLLAPQGNQFNPLGKPEDPGMCKETEKCD